MRCGGNKKMINNLTLIREACIAAVPEIMKLKAGCLVKIKTGGMIKYKGESSNCLYAYVMAEKANKHTIIVDDGTEYGKEHIKEILGRPIRLSDVLVAIEVKRKEKKGWEWMIDGRGTFWTTNGSDIQNIAIFWKEHGLKNHEEGYKIFWNLLDDDLSHQSEETLQFLSGLLK